MNRMSLEYGFIGALLTAFALAPEPRAATKPQTPRKTQSGPVVDTTRESKRAKRRRLARASTL